jgi:hypothetical protein
MTWNTVYESIYIAKVQLIQMVNYVGHFQLFFILPHGVTDSDLIYTNELKIRDQSAHSLFLKLYFILVVMNWDASGLAHQKSSLVMMATVFQLRKGNAKSTIQCIV